MTLKKVQPGQPLNIPASTFNTLIDVAQVFRQQQHGIGGPNIGAEPRNAGVVRVRNDTGDAVSQFGILGIDGPLILPEDNEQEFRQRLAINGVAPITPGKFVVLQEPVPAGAIAREAVIAGVTAVQIDLTDLAHTRADVGEGGTDYLDSSDDGSAEILWHEMPYEGIQWAIVRLGGGGGGGGVECFVRTNEEDFCDYLEEKFVSHNNPGVFVSGQDLTFNVDTEEGGESPTTRQLRIFLDASARPNYNGSKMQLLGHKADGGWDFFDVVECEESLSDEEPSS